jgi:hypothetical protein
LEGFAMKIASLLTVAGFAAASLMTAAPAPAPAQVRVVVGAPTGPGWSRWRERRMARRGWDGPGWYSGRGEHYGWYRWRNNYYQNCSWRWTRRHVREWRCW